MTVRVATVQAEPAWLDAEATAVETVDLAAETADKRAGLVAFPRSGQGERNRRASGYQRFTDIS